MSVLAFVMLNRRVTISSVKSQEDLKRCSAICRVIRTRQKPLVLTKIDSSATAIVEHFGDGLAEVDFVVVEK